MAYGRGAAGELFHLNLKINTNEKGFPLKFHLKGADYAAVVPNALLVAQYLRHTLPMDADIFYATVTRDNSARDSRLLRGAIGAGTFEEAAGPPITPANYNRPEDASLVRFENTEGQNITYKIPCIPDIIVNDAALQGGAVADVVGMPGVLAAPAAGLDWFLNFNLFMKSVVKYCIYVKSSHGPGAAFDFAQFENAYFLRTGVKKGGRVSAS